jgi:hypothetical protein
MQKSRGISRPNPNPNPNQFRYPKYKFDGQSQISGLFDTWSMDFLGPFPRSEVGNSYILTKIEHLSGAPVLTAVKSATADVACAGGAMIIANYGLPKEIRADNNPFGAHNFRDWCEKRKIELNLTPAHQPEWTAFVENMNRQVRYALTKMCDGGWRDWEKFLPTIQFALRARVSSRTGYSPFFLLFGVNPRFPGDVASGSSMLMNRLVEVESLPGIRKDLERQAVSGSVDVDFPLGSLVVVLVPKLRKKQFHPKREYRYEGPYRVVMRYPHQVYRLIGDDGKVVICHASRLLAYVAREDAPP